MNSSLNSNVPPSAGQGMPGGSTELELYAVVDELLHVQGQLLYVTRHLTTSLPPATRTGLRAPLALTLQDAIGGFRVLVNQLEGLLAQPEA